MNFNPADHPHRRFNPLTEEWVLVSPHRAKRPWQGQVEHAHAEVLHDYDNDCYLCPGNKRGSAQHEHVNPSYKDVFVFTNDFPALVDTMADGEVNTHPLLKMKSEKGICRVVCFSPRHDLTIPELETSAIKKVVDVWADEYKTLGAMDFINYVQIFENKGAVMGCSNPHPHGQIWAQESIPDEPLKKTHSQKKYWTAHGTSLLGDYLGEELKLQSRIIFENDAFVALVPFWAVWPFETMIIPKRQVENILQLTEAEKMAFADAYKRVTILYDNLFQTSFPYSAGIHQSPTDGKPHPYWHLHAVFYPPLLRSAKVKKFMVGYELLAEPQRDTTPEESAALLRQLPSIHYKQK